jgi:hypothetical protein
MTSDERDSVIEHLWPVPANARAMNAYVILDTARDERIYEFIRSSGLQSQCLYSGRIPIELAKVAPYLLRLEKDHPSTEWLIDAGWGESWGIFLHSGSRIDTLRQHFHSFLTVETEDGKRMVFRYYDPRVFRVYLPTCRIGELKTVFGPVRNFILETGDPSFLVNFRLESDRLIGRHHSLIQWATEDLTP